MARCEKCLMDPCLCHLDGFGPEDEDETTKKELNELMGRRCIVKASLEGDKRFFKIIQDYDPKHRATDVYGKIVKMHIVVDPEKDPHAAELIDLHLEEDNPLPPDMHPLPLFFVQYDEPGPMNLPGHWYIDEEVLYI